MEMESLLRRAWHRQLPRQPLPPARLISIVVRILGNIPALDTLSLPPVLSELIIKRGLIPIVRRHWFRQVI